jgi:uncharacterized YigZ family protein
MGKSADTFKTITVSSQDILFKDRKSKFYGYAFPIKEESEVKPIIERLRKQYPNAGHFCYAWQLGREKQRYRANDDGEPKNSAGKPIYGQIQSYELTDVLVVVLRIFGGAKLGVSGLINAYRTAAQMALESANIEERLIESKFELVFEYPLMNEVMRLLKKLQIRIVSQQMERSCKIITAVPKSKTEKVQLELEKIHQLRTTLL